MLSCMVFTAPQLTSVVTVAKSAEFAMPNRVSLPSIFPPGCVSVAVIAIPVFASIGVPGAAAHDLPVNIADLRLPGVQMLLGADFLGRRQVWISYATGRLFVR